MSQHQTPESVEAEAARVRSQLVELGADLRAHIDPTAIGNAAKASFARRSTDAPKFLRKNSTPIGLMLLGGAFGATFIGLMARPRKASPSAEPAGSPRGRPKSAKSKARFEAALLSTLSVGLGYFGGLFIPNTPTEQKLLGEPKALLSARLDAFLNQHTRGMQMAAANSIWRLAAVGRHVGRPRRSGRCAWSPQSQRGS